MGIKIKPLADRVLVEPAAAETKTASGIIIPDNAKEKPQKGTIVAVGNGKKDEPLTVKVGDTRYFLNYRKLIRTSYQWISIFHNSH